MSSAVNKKDTHHDNICEDFMRERAAVLSRTGNVLNDVLDTLVALEQDIQKKTKLLENMESDNNKGGRKAEEEKQALCMEINSDIEKFNAARKTAQLKYYYFIVTREAMGLRRHDRVFEIYKLPEKKKKIQAF